MVPGISQPIATGPSLNNIKVPFLFRIYKILLKLNKISI